MLGALRTLGLRVEEDYAIKQAIVEGCGGKFPTGIEPKGEVNLFLGNAGTAMRPLTAAVTAAGGNSRFVSCIFKSSFTLILLPSNHTFVIVHALENT